MTFRLQTLDKGVEIAVEDELPAVDDDHFLAKVRDVVHIVGSEQYRHVVLLLVGAEEFPQVNTRDDVESDGGFV